MAYNSRSPAVKRLMKEAQELSEPTELFHAQPLEDNLFEWHFTIRGPSDTDFADGIYHGRIILPTEYPMKPPNILLLTPNGRFDINKKICLSISGYHPESWRPSWSIRTALLAIIGFMPTHGSGAIGSLDYPPEERKRLAKLSQSYRCSNCGETKSILQPLTEASSKDSEEAKDLAKQIVFQAEKKPSTTSESSESVAASPSVERPIVSPSANVETNPQVPFTNFTYSGSAVPNNLMPTFPNMWSYPNPYLIPVGQPILPNSQPLSFIDWLTQVKGYTPIDQSGAVPPSPSPPPTTAEPSASGSSSGQGQTADDNREPSSLPTNSEDNNNQNQQFRASDSTPTPESETQVRQRSPTRSPHVHGAPPMDFDTASSSNTDDRRARRTGLPSRLLLLLYVIMALLGLLLTRRCLQAIL